MTCRECGGTHFVRADNYNTCTTCGVQAEYNCKYYNSYANGNVMSLFRRQYYSRAKRFMKVLKGMRSDIIGANFEHILQTYSYIEFLWNMKPDKTRKYFFSQKVVLWFILQRLEIKLDVPVLKNKDRTLEQVTSMEALLPDCVCI